MRSSLWRRRLVRSFVLGSAALMAALHLASLMYFWEPWKALTGEFEIDSRAGPQNRTAVKEGFAGCCPSTKRVSSIGEASPFSLIDPAKGEQTAQSCANAWFKKFLNDGLHEGGLELDNELSPLRMSTAPIPTKPGYCFRSAASGVCL
jgi:hypothetical protein